MPNKFVSAVMSDIVSSSNYPARTWELIPPDLNWRQGIFKGIRAHESFMLGKFCVKCTALIQVTPASVIRIRPLQEFLSNILPEGNL